MSFLPDIKFEMWTAILLVILTYVIYCYLPIHYTYWKNLGINYEKPGYLPSVSFFWHFLRKPLHETDQQNYEKYGRIHGQFEGTEPVLYLAEPELLKQVLVKDFNIFTNQRDFSFNNPLVDNMIFVLKDEQWKRVRTIVTPAFTTGKIKKMTKFIKDSSHVLCDNILKQATGKSVDIRKFFQMFTMDVIAQSAFATKIDFYSDEGKDFFTKGRKLFTFQTNWKTITAIMFPKVAKFFKLDFFDATSSEFFINLVSGITEGRKESKQVHHDFLQQMIDASKEYEKNHDNNGEIITTSPKLNSGENDLFVADEHKDKESQASTTSFKYKGLSHDEMVAQCATFLAVGFDTTATSLATACYCLALNQDCQERLFDEVSSVLKANEGELSYETIQSMTYLDKFIAETLRLYPAVVRMERTPNEDYDFGSHNLFLKKNIPVTIPVYAMHRDPEFYPDPEKFDPERFDVKEKESRHPYAYLPFGAGPRVCLGMRFAMMEMKFCLATVVSKMRFTKLPETKVPLEFLSGQTLMQPKDILLGVIARHN